MLVDGLDTRTQGREVRRRVGFVFQDPDAQIVHPTVEEDLAFGPHNQGVPADETARRVDEMLVRYDLAGHRDHPGAPAQRRTEAAAGDRGRAGHAARSGSCSTSRRRCWTWPTPARVSRVIDELEQDVVVVTHHLDLLDDFDRVLVFDDGRVVADGSPGETVPWYVARMG